MLVYLRTFVICGNLESQTLNYKVHEASHSSPKTTLHKSSCASYQTIRGAWTTERYLPLRLRSLVNHHSERLSNSLPHTAVPSDKDSEIFQLISKLDPLLQVLQNSIMDEEISMVSAITGATSQVARHYLSLTDGDAEQAIQLFYDSPDLSSSMAQESSTAPPEPASQIQDRSQSVNRRDPPAIVDIDSDSDDDVPMDTDPDFEPNYAEIRNPISSTTPNIPSANYGSYEDDEAVARRMQEELYAGGDMAGDYDTQGVRAPLGRTTETLVGPGADWTAEDMQAAVLQQMRARQQQPRSRMFLLTRKCEISRFEQS